MKSLVMAMVCIVLLSHNTDLKSLKSEECETESLECETESLKIIESETYDSTAYIEDFEDYQLIIGTEGKKVRACRVQIREEGECARYVLDDYSFYVLYNDGFAVHYNRDGEKIKELYNFYIQPLEEFQRMTGVD